MSCYGCCTKFNFFNRGNGCPNCGFSYCNKCLRYKSVVSKLNNSKVNVCKQCYGTLTEGTQESSTMKQYSPPAAFLRRMESLENPARPPITMYRHDQRMQQLKSGLEPPDQEIAERLEKLREERKKGPIPSDHEVAERLAQLRGEDLATATKKFPIYEAADRRTDEEKAHDLMKQYTAQQVLDSKLPNSDEEIEIRLAKLRAQSNAQIEIIMKPSNDGSETRSAKDPVSALLKEVESKVEEDSSDWTDIEKAAQASLRAFHAQVKTNPSKHRDKEETGVEAPSSDDEETLHIINKVCEEAAMEAKMEEMELEDELQDTEKNDQLPESSWCTICAEEAAIKCLDCNGALYCSDPECFMEEHDGIKHKTVPFHHQFR